MFERGSPAERHFLRLIIVFVGVIALGTLGYVVVEGWGVLDSLYMSVITITTVGFLEVEPLSSAGRVFTILLSLGGLAVLWYTLSVMVGVVVGGQISRSWEQRKMEQTIAKLRKHQIVCGYGRVGRNIALELAAEQRDVVVVDKTPEGLQMAHDDGFPVVNGDATDDEVLRKAGIDRAAGLITAVETDADNTFVTLTARALNADLVIVARANSEAAASKLMLAGATQAVSPYRMAGRQMARLAVRPSTVEFVESLLHGAEGELLLEDLRVDEDSMADGQPVADIQQRFSDLVLLAILRDGRTASPPPPDMLLQEGDVMAVVGREGPLRSLEQACQTVARKEESRL